MSAIKNAITVLNSNSPAILVVQRFMLMARVQRAAKLGDVDAQRYVRLCEMNTVEVTKH